MFSIGRHLGASIRRAAGAGKKKSSYMQSKAPINDVCQCPEVGLVAGESAWLRCSSLLVRVAMRFAFRWRWRLEYVAMQTHCSTICPEQRLLIIASLRKTCAKYVPCCVEYKMRLKSGGATPFIFLQLSLVFSQHGRYWTHQTVTAAAPRGRQRQKRVQFDFSIVIGSALQCV